MVTCVFDLIALKKAVLYVLPACDDLKQIIFWQNQLELQSFYHVYLSSHCCAHIQSTPWHQIFIYFFCQFIETFMSHAKHPQALFWVFELPCLLPVSFSYRFVFDPVGHLFFPVSLPHYCFYHTKKQDSLHKLNSWLIVIKPCVCRCCSANNLSFDVRVDTKFRLHLYCLCFSRWVYNLQKQLDPLAKWKSILKLKMQTLVPRAIAFVL